VIVRSLVVIVLFAVIFASAVVISATRFQLAAETTTPPCIDPENRERVRAIMLEALDEALKEHTKRLFDVWQKDPNSNQPRRAINGMQATIRAHVNSRTAALNWNPPSC
jgi:hypothetical protein